MRSRSCVVLSALALSAAAHPVRAQQPPPYIPLTQTWHITVSNDGRVTRMAPVKNKLTERVPEIRQKLEEAVHSWVFSPGKIDGKPAETETTLIVFANLLPEPDGSSGLQIKNVHVGGGFKQRVTPEYPQAAISRLAAGEVVVKVTYGADGKVLSAKKFKDGPNANHMLVVAATEAVKRSIFLPEIVGGHPLPGVALIPYCFTLHGPYGLLGKCDWKAPGESNALQQGEALALNPAAHLVSKVAGKTL